MIRRSATRGARALTLLEVAIAVGLAALVFAVTIEFLLGTQRQVTTSSAHQRANGESRRLVRLIAQEVRGLNLSTADLIPAAPADSTSLQSRVVTGYDTSSGEPTLSPSRASGAFRRIRLTGDAITREDGASGEVTLASGVSDLRFTLTAPNKLTIEVAVRARDHQGVLVERRATLLIALPNVS